MVGIEFEIYLLKLKGALMRQMFFMRTSLELLSSVECWSCLLRGNSTSPTSTLHCSVDTPNDFCGTIVSSVFHAHLQTQVSTYNGSVLYVFKHYLQ